MTKKALIHFGVRLSREWGRHHGEVHHAVARRGFMTLRALRRARRRMRELSDGPLSGGMALHAVGPEKILMTVLCRMTADTAEHRLIGAQARMIAG